MVTPGHQSPWQYTLDPHAELYFASITSNSITFPHKQKVMHNVASSSFCLKKNYSIEPAASTCCNKRIKLKDQAHYPVQSAFFTHLEHLENIYSTRNLITIKLCMFGAHKNTASQLKPTGQLVRYIKCWTGNYMHMPECSLCMNASIHVHACTLW